MKQGLVHLYCGDGKGKTTAAIGLCVRAAGRGLRVLLVQFLKGNPTGELAILDKLEQVTVLRQTEQLGFTFRMNEQQKQHAAQVQQQLFEQARRQMQQYDLLILDEVMAAINTGMLSVQQVAELIEHRPPQLELVMTGRSSWSSCPTTFPRLKRKSTRSTTASRLGTASNAKPTPKERIVMEKIHLQQVLPADIEKRSFEIITEELLSRGKADAILPENELVVKRVIHTTADFDYVDNLCISEGAVQKGMQALKNGACIVTDTQMARSGINKKKLAQFGGEVFCFISDEDVAAQAKQQGTTRATASMEKAAKLDRPLIFAIGNAPTALVKLNELMEQGLRPELIIGVPVGFVNVVEAKELILRAPVPYIVARGRKGGSNVAAAICNAMLYQL